MSIDHSTERKFEKPSEETRKRARKEMDELRESIRKRAGTLEIAVSYTRESRDE
jgi:hypothetical protein